MKGNPRFFIKLSKTKLSPKTTKLFNFVSTTDFKIISGPMPDGSPIVIANGISKFFIKF